MAKRKRSALTTVDSLLSDPSLLTVPLSNAVKTRQPSTSVPAITVLPKSAPANRRARRTATSKDQTNPNVDPHIIDAPNALRASPDGAVDGAPSTISKMDITSESELSDIPSVECEPALNGRKDSAGTVHDFEHSAAAGENVAEPVQGGGLGSDFGAEDGEANEDELKEALGRPPPINSADLPLPWKGRLGYACLNTYLRTSNPPVFSSRTCRIASILEHRHPLADPSQPEHATKNRPDRNQAASVQLGQQYVEAIGLANARDVVKMVRWNDRYGIKFMRLSSEMFPFASHEEYGYKLAPFAADTLAEAGQVIASLGHRVTTHPGQFTQLGSPRKSVIDNSLRDLEYHDEMLSLLKLPEQQNKDAVMILHMGGVFGDKVATLDRFRENYAKLSQSVKNRLVLENDDVSWHVHDLLPICHELNIPLVLDFHHHNILFDNTKIREGTLDIIGLYDEIRGTWTRKGITQKMHYSEQTAAAITPRQRRKHSPRVMTLPPCGQTMDLMIEAKDKEQAVFELMRTFKLPGFEKINEVIPHIRQDENKAIKPAKKTPTKKKKKNAAAEDDEVEMSLDNIVTIVPEEDVGMGGPDRRVYWPTGMEEWLKPPKRIVKKSGQEDTSTKTPRKTAKKIISPASTTKAKTDGKVRSNSITPKPVRKKKAKAKATAKAIPDDSANSDEGSCASDGFVETDSDQARPRKRGRPKKAE